MDEINPIVMSIIKTAKKGDTIKSLADRTVFAYSVVYKWVNRLKDLHVLDLKNDGNKKIVFMNKNDVYMKLMELSLAIEVIDKDNYFWSFMRKTIFNVRLVKGTAAVVWTNGGYVTGDFYNKIYHVEVLKKDYNSFVFFLEKNNIAFGKENSFPGDSRPFVYIKVRKSFVMERKNKLPVMPLKELVSWSKKLHLESILEQLDLTYNLGLNERYSEVYVNV